MFSRLRVEAGLDVMFDAEEGYVSSRTAFAIDKIGAEIVLRANTDGCDQLTICDLPIANCQFNFIQCGIQSRCFIGSSWIHQGPVAFVVERGAKLDVLGRPLEVRSIEAEVHSDGVLDIETLRCASDTRILAASDTRVLGPSSTAVALLLAEQNADVSMNQISTEGQIQYHSTAKIAFTSCPGAKILTTVFGTQCVVFLGQ
jgi:hypothetical protein